MESIFTSDPCTIYFHGAYVAERGNQPAHRIKGAGEGGGAGDLGIAPLSTVEDSQSLENYHPVLQDTGSS